MIKDIFIPSNLGTYYVFGQRILSFDIDKTEIHATTVYLKGNTTTIEQFFNEPLEPGTQTNYAQRVTKALKKIIKKAGKFDHIYSTVSSTQLVFKELQLPFDDYSKIKMVINFEIEPQLPFSAADAVIDFIITKHQPAQSSCTVLVAAAQRHTIEQHIALFKDAGVQPNVLMVDFFGLYGLYKKLPVYTKITGGVALVSLDIQSTRIAYIDKGELSFIRALPKGMSHVAQSISTALDLSLEQAAEEFMRFGTNEHDNNKYNEACKKALNELWNEIQFTLDSFVTQSNGKNGLKKILLLGSGATIKGIKDFAHASTNVPTELFDTKSILSDKNITLKKSSSIPAENIFSLSSALPSEITTNFNLKPIDRVADTHLFNKQIFVGLALILIICGALAVNSFLQIRKLRNALYASEQEAVRALKEQFTRIENDETNLEDVISVAEGAVNQEEKLWLAFSAQARSSFLKYLLELTNKIDKEALGFSLEKINISDNTMTIKGLVKSHEALAILEKELQSSDLFKQIGPLEDPNFEVKIILAKNGEEQL